MAEASVNDLKKLKRSHTNSDQFTGRLLQISFVDPLGNFKNTQFGKISTILNSLSDSWKFVAFTFDHAAALICESNLLHIEKFFAASLESEITIKEHSAGKSRGIIYNKFLNPCTEKYLAEQLESQGVVECYKIQKVDPVSAASFYTGSVILVFQSGVEVESVTVDNVKLLVTKLLPRPMFCKNCGSIGHLMNKCKKSDSGLCKQCFTSHDISTDCDLQCKHCNGLHFPNDKDCDAIREEINILTRKEALNISYFDARALVNKFSYFVC